MLAPLLLLGSASVWGAPTLLATLSDKDINESSGLAPSIASKGVWYTHNDSGDKPRFFRFNEKGEVTGVFSLIGAQAQDWEDMASQRLGGKNWLYLGDIGDNARRRTSITVYRTEEPKGASRDIPINASFEIVYEDRARDCEALFIAPKSGDLWLVSKAREGETWAYVVRKPNKSGRYTAKKVARLTVDTGSGVGGTLVTGGDVSADGKRVILRTYSGALEYLAPKKFDDWVKAQPQPVTTRGEQQGEAIAYARDGLRILTTSEGSPCPVAEMKKKTN
jgi:hypothetical protein